MRCASFPFEPKTVISSHTKWMIWASLLCHIYMHEHEHSTKSLYAVWTENTQEDNQWPVVYSRHIWGRKFAVFFFTRSQCPRVRVVQMQQWNVQCSLLYWIWAHTWAECVFEHQFVCSCCEVLMGFILPTTKLLPSLMTSHTWQIILICLHSGKKECNWFCTASHWLWRRRMLKWHSGIVFRRKNSFFLYRVLDWVPQQVAGGQW